ncbi:RNA-binding protein 45-like [Planococcus citri]|uniref:RNA-binding protein 45-like n=1 Tax=Planococcus citri TaxID=170843 RepID=UPI0031F8487B
MVSAGMKDHMVSDDPPYSRLFVVYNRKDPVSEAELRNDFGKYGEIQDVFIVKDRASGNAKGVAYIKFPKMSEAALAMENLNNTPIKGHVGVYKAYIAKNRGESPGPDHNDPDRFVRLFIMVPKSAAEDDIRQHFTKFGDVTTVKLLRHKDTNESRGIGYVTYARVYDAAKAVESGENELGFKAVIARPKEKIPPPAESSTSNHSSSYSSYSNSHTSKSRPSKHSSSHVDHNTGGDSFQATVSSKLDKDHIFRLFDIAPGLRNIQIISQNMYRTDLVAIYNSPLAAEYALNKLQGLEYPLGDYICVESKGVNKPSVVTTPSYNMSASGSIGTKRDYRGEQIIEHRSASPVSSNGNREVNSTLTALTKALSDATALLKTAGVSTESIGYDDMSDNRSSSSYCQFPLPPPQKVLPKTAFNENTGRRLFFVGHPAAPPLDALYDVYCRFGNFTGASVLQKKNYGYLYFTCPHSAQRAIDATDDKTIAGVTIKVLPAEPKAELSNKRKKTDM